VAGYLVTGGTLLGPDRFEVDVLLVEARTGRTVWAESFERRLQPSEIVALRNEVANLVARTLGQPYGVIHGDRARDADGEPPEAFRSYVSVLRFYTYLADLRPDEPDYAEACACLSLFYSNAYRFRPRPAPTCIGRGAPGRRPRALVRGRPGGRARGA
jgi:adenylate cyclase